MSRYAISLGLGLAAQFLAASLCLPRALQAQQAAPAPTNATTPAPTNAAARVPNPSSHDAAIIRLRDVAYGKDEDGNYKEPSVRVREAAKEALKQEVIEQVQEEDAARAGPQAATAARGSNSATAANYSQAAAIPAGASTGDALLLNFEAGFSPMQTFGVSPNQPFSPGQIGPGEGTAGSELAPQLGGEIGAIQSVPPGPGETTSTSSADAGAQPTLAGYLKDSDSVQDVETQERSAVSLDPHVRGYKWGQIYADVDGAYWTPARLDMDTMLSKIDPGMVSSVNVLSGPYGVRYGPGFAFLDINRVATPRYEDCSEMHLDSMLDVRSNGGQVYARETVSGGGANWGFRGSFGERLGSDYRAGDGTLIPANYHSRDAWGELGYDIDPHQHVSLPLSARWTRRACDNPGQFFDTNYLGSYGFQMALRERRSHGPLEQVAAPRPGTTPRGSTATRARGQTPISP